MATPKHQLETPGTGRRAVVVAGVFAGLLLALWFFFLRGGAEEEPFAAPAAPAVTEAELEAEGEIEGEARRGRGGPFEGGGGRRGGGPPPPTPRPRSKIPASGGTPSRSAATVCGW
jgi:hypothetical protein